MLQKRHQQILKRPKKKLPLLSYNQRKKIIINIKGVKKVVPQDNWDDTINIQKFKPDIVVHGDDWKFGIEKDLRKKSLVNKIIIFSLTIRKNFFL